MKFNQSRFALGVCLAPFAVASTLAQAAESTQYLRFEGALVEDRLGVSIGHVGDVNGDGYADILSGARYADVGGFVDAGSAFVFSGKDGSTLYQFDGEGDGDWFGMSVTGIGDVNGDARADILVGAQFAHRADGLKTGSAYVYSGADGSRLYRLDGERNDGRFGVAVGGGLDVNGDAVPDFIVGAYMNDAAYVYSGATGTLITKLSGTAMSWQGFAVALLPDITGDGRAEVVVTAPRTGAGKAVVYSSAGFSALYTFNGVLNGDWFGFAAAAAGDLNGDGKTELLIGAREATPNGLTNAGSVSVYSGSNGSLLKRLDGAAARDRFGTSVDAAGDVNRDGTNDIVIGSRFASNAAGVTTGAALVYSGSDFAEITRVYGESDEDWFGGSVAFAGDTNGDGWVEWMVGAAGSDPRGDSNAGRAYVFGQKHSDVTVGSLQIPKSGKAGTAITVSYSLTNNGDAGNMVSTLTVGGAKRATSTGVTLDFLGTASESFSYTLRTQDFVSGRTKICVKTSIEGATDLRDVDNTQCAIMSQTN